MNQLNCVHHQRGALRLRAPQASRIPESVVLPSMTVRHRSAAQRQQPQRCCAAAAAEKLEARPLPPDDFVQDRMDFLREDLAHLFDEQGIDKTAYEEKVNFQDPLTNHSTLTGYLFNIQFLRYMFGPKFILHDLRRSGDHEITSRWTMRMSLQLNRFSPLRRWWDPQLVFTGVSIMSLNSESGKFVSHIDYWDAIENQKFLSLEALRHLVGQLTFLGQAPKGLDTPDYMIMRRFSDCEVRRYEPFLVCETDTQDITSSSSTSSSGSSGSSSNSSSNSSSSSSGKGAFFRLADYIFGKANDRSEKMAMTTPVLTTSSGRMQFVIGKADKELSNLPSPTESSVALRRQPAGHFAAVTFSGVADNSQVQQQLQRLRRAMAARGLKPKSEDYMVARYNDPGTKAVFRRNEVLCELEDFELW